MDYYNMTYGGDQYSADLTPPFPDEYSKNMEHQSLPTTHMGVYEDKFRYDQYKIPANMRCAEPNPYIQDDIRKSQRHNPIRTMNIPMRADVIAKTSCEPGLYGIEKPIAHGQKVFLETNANTCSNCPNCAKSNNCELSHMKCDNCDSCHKNYKNYKNNRKESMLGNLDMMDDTNMTLVLLFIFIVVVCMFCYYWKSISELKEMIVLLKESISAQK